MHISQCNDDVPGVFDPQEFVEAKIALDDRWSCALAEAVVTAKEAGRAEVK